MNAKSRLGKGLNALIPEIEETMNVREIDIDKIRTNPDQPRKEFDEDNLRELADSLKEHGLIQPVMVSPELDGYVLVAGERRFRAAKLANLNKIPAIVREADSEDKLKLALVENLQREDLNPLEEAAAYRVLVEEYGLTQELVARSVGKSRSAVANRLRLLSLPEEIKRALSSGDISAGQARTLLGIKDDKELLRVAAEIMKKKTSVRDVEKEVSAIKKNIVNKKNEPGAEERDRMINLTDLKERLQRHFGTRVALNHGEKRGSIVIEYYGEEDLTRLTELLLGGKEVL